MSAETCVRCSESTSGYICYTTSNPCVLYHTVLYNRLDCTRSICPSNDLCRSEHCSWCLHRCIHILLDGIEFRLQPCVVRVALWFSPDRTLYIRVIQTWNCNELIHMYAVMCMWFAFDIYNISM